LLCLVATFFSQPSFAHKEDMEEQAQGISLNIKNKQISEVISQIESSTDFLFVQSDLDKNDLKKKVSIQAQNMDIKQLLQLVFEKTSIQYRIVDRQVILFKEKESTTGSSLRNFIQKFFTVSGVINDSEGIPIAGA